MNMKKLLTSTTILILLVGCTSSNQIVLPNGEIGFTVDCGGTANSWSSCYEEAGEVCPIGYEILEQNEERIQIGSSPGINRMLVISCGS
jgi:hypothetical protein